MVFIVTIYHCVHSHKLYNLLVLLIQLFFMWLKEGALVPSLVTPEASYSHSGLQTLANTSLGVLFFFSFFFFKLKGSGIVLCTKAAELSANFSGLNYCKLQLPASCLHPLSWQCHQGVYPLTFHNPLLSFSHTERQTKPYDHMI